MLDDGDGDRAVNDGDRAVNDGDRAVNLFTCHLEATHSTEIFVIIGASQLILYVGGVSEYFS